MFAILFVKPHADFASPPYHRDTTKKKNGLESLTWYLPARVITNELKYREIKETLSQEKLFLLSRNIMHFFRSLLVLSISVYVSGRVVFSSPSSSTRALAILSLGRFFQSHSGPLYLITKVVIDLLIFAVSKRPATGQPRPRVFK